MPVLNAFIVAEHFEQVAAFHDVREYRSFFIPYLDLLGKFAIHIK